MKSPYGILWKGVLEPLTHVWTDLKISKESNVLIQVMVTCWGSSFFSESFSVRRLREQLQAAPIPPLVPKITRRVKDPISTSSTICWYFRFFSSSCSLIIVDVAFPWLHLELTCVTLTSKSAVTPRDQKPPPLKSSLASGLVTALLRLNRSLSSGCGCGSTSTLVQTLPISEVSRLRTPSCLCASNPPFLHDRVWQTVYFSAQTHLLGKSDRLIL